MRQLPQDIEAEKSAPAYMDDVRWVVHPDTAREWIKWCLPLRPPWSGPCEKCGSYTLHQKDSHNTQCGNKDCK